MFLGRAAGTLTFTFNSGATVYSCQGPLGPGFGPLPGNFHYTVSPPPITAPWPPGLITLVAAARIISRLPSSRPDLK